MHRTLLFPMCWATSITRRFPWHYSALVDSFCSEQNARMAAMDSANQNAQALLDDLSAQFHHARQSAITQEISSRSQISRARWRVGFWAV